VSDPKSAWLPDWQAMQKQFFNAWTDAARKGAAPDFPVHEGFDAWLKLFGQRDTNNEVLDRVIGSGKQFADFMQGVIGQLATVKPDMAGPGKFREAMEQAFGAISPKSNPVVDALRGMVGEGARGFEQLMGDFTKAAQPFEGELRGLLSLPAFGYSREGQEQRQAMARAMLEYNEANARYHELMMKAARLGLDRFESKLGERSEPGRELSSMRALFDLYIDAAEEGYAEVAMSPEFRAAYGELVNAQMRVRQRVQQEIERQTAALGMPVRSEMESVHKRMHEMRRRIADLEEKLAAVTGALATSAPAAPVAAPAEPTPDAAPKRVRKPAPKAAAKSAAPKAAAAPADKPADKPAAAKPAAKSTRRSRSA
jgi:class III poly(R)-hydroxyalkanoic acid synthase PhaE subunit